jgi:hypothetical protein
LSSLFSFLFFPPPSIWTQFIHKAWLNSHSLSVINLCILYFSILLHLLALNICSFVRQCNTFTSQTLSRHVSASHGHHQL